MKAVEPMAKLLAFAHLVLKERHKSQMFKGLHFKLETFNKTI